MADEKKKTEPPKTPPPPDTPSAASRTEVLATSAQFPTGSAGPQQVEVVNTVDVSLQQTITGASNAQALWALIHASTRNVTFAQYNTVIAELCTPDTTQGKNLLHGLDAYEVLHTTTELFLLAQCDRTFITTLRNYPLEEEKSRFGGQPPDSAGIVAAIGNYVKLSRSVLPYIHAITRSLVRMAPTTSGPFCTGDVPVGNLQPCFLELLWSYWMEEGGLVQAINAITLRFQNKRGNSEREPLANFELHPLRPLANLLWGYVQDDDHRLTIARRAYEYEHQYGLSLVGKAVPRLRVAERRSKFLESFHSLLHEAAVYYDRAANLTMRPDGFPLLTALREVHLLLAEGAHNQFRDLTWTARVEMLIQQWLLSRPEMLMFLGSRASIPYPEPWMGPVDSLKRLMGWSDTPITYFHDLAIAGEQILLSIRYGDWSNVNNEEEARGWAQFWKTEVQRYIHAYRTVTGVDLGATPANPISRRIDATPPSVLLAQRLARQRR